jgi:AbrB family looped-hinge helix DNA binding protein
VGFEVEIRDLTVDSKGRVTIPKDIRERYDLEPGDEVSVGFGAEVMVDPSD